jgi:dTDP-4-amino-4,6-dideoxygalactose transaminase
LLDLRAQYATIRTEIDEAVMRVAESQHFILGPEVTRCEAAIARYCGCARAVGVSSGTDALLVCLMAEGIGPGDEVLTTPYSFFATAGAVARLGARPVFADIRPDTYNLDVTALERLITPRTRAIIPVHLFGQMCEMDRVMDLASRHRLVVIEDAAQAIGAEGGGARAGTVGHYGCFSFFPSKNLGAFGDGGMVTTNDEARAERVAILRGHGARPKYHHAVVGGNFRLDALQAAVVSAKLPHLDAWIAARQRNAARYRELLDRTGLIERGVLSCPAESTDRHVFNQFVVRLDNRDGVQSALRAADVGSEVYYPVPLHLQRCFGPLGYKTGDFPNAEEAARSTLALPIFPELTTEQQEWIVSVIQRFYS